MRLADVYCWIGHAGLGEIWWILTKRRKRFGGKCNTLCSLMCICLSLKKVDTFGHKEKYQ